MSFNEQLRELRKNNKMTQAELADLIGLKRSTVTQYENGRISPSKEVLIKIANLFRVTLDDIVGSETENLEMNNIDKINMEKQIKNNDITYSIKNAISQKIVSELIASSDDSFYLENKSLFLKLFDLLIDLNIKAESEGHSSIQLKLENIEYDYSNVITKFSKELSKLEKLSDLLK